MMMRPPKSPKWGQRVLEVWVKTTMVRMKRGEVSRVTFEGVWRGGVKRRLLTNEQSMMHRGACEQAMKLGQLWDPPPDRIQARLWSKDKRYFGSQTWQIGGRSRPRPLERGEVPQKRAASSSKGARTSSREEAVVDAEAAAFRASIVKRLSELEGAMKSVHPPSKTLDTLHRRLADVEAENRLLREAVSVVWNELSEPVLLDVYKRLRKLYREQELNWDSIRPITLPEKWPNITSD